MLTAHINKSKKRIRNYNKTEIRENTTCNSTAYFLCRCIKYGVVLHVVTLQSVVCVKRNEILRGLYGEHVCVE